MAHRSAGALQGSRKINPVETEDRVSLGNNTRGFGSKKHAGRAGMQRMIGRKSGGNFQIGDDPRTQCLGECDTDCPGGLIA